MTRWLRHSQPILLGTYFNTLGYFRHPKSGFLVRNSITTRGVPIIGSAKISATDMVIFTNIGIGMEDNVETGSLLLIRMTH